MKKLLISLCLILMLCLLLAACTEKPTEQDATKPAQTPTASAPDAASPAVESGPGSNAATEESSQFPLSTDAGKITVVESSAQPDADPDEEEDEGGLNVVDEIIVEVTGDVSFGGND